jgi:hypothetical protein
MKGAAFDTITRLQTGPLTPASAFLEMLVAHRRRPLSPFRVSAKLWWLELRLICALSWHPGPGSFFRMGSGRLLSVPPRRTSSAPIAISIAACTL